MRSVVTNRVAWSVVYVTVVSPAKTAEPIEMPFGICTRVGPMKHVLSGGAHRRHLANTIEPSMCGGDAACCHITVTTSLVFVRYESCSHVQNCALDRPPFPQFCT